MAYLKCMEKWGKKALLAISLACCLTNTINAEDNKHTLKDICIKAVRSCSGHSNKIDYGFFDFSPFQRCVANTVVEAQKTGWDTAGEVAVGVAKGVGMLAVGALKVTGALLIDAANMLFSKERCWNDKRRDKICRNEPFIETEEVYGI